ncbi:MULTISPECIES: TetR/AcrR family transcriptional regulator [unclassified Pseudarthrobacter]|uniref:TetR/AcrR family transcriptional regulator n=1 Tax=unclassified Pseudarthrobacter TaxID=2647000 RepID=UPI0011314EB7|nr:TetR/AcrR family transcriptional regulator [Pseudarthrobacter sp. NIBRBAC000502772]QDG67308.1 TetR/AcrR family transcriptional regulator [Pseudarthrobacter sp. NIBRBAC000502772]
MTGTKGALRQTTILDAAEEVLVAKGNAGSAMRDFAAAAGVRVGHLQHYFPTRADLIRAVLDRSLKRSLQRLKEMSGIGVGDGPGAGELLTRKHSERLFTALLAEHSDPAGVGMHVEVWAIAAADEQIAAVVRAFYAQYAEHVADLVERARPELGEPQRNAVASTVVGLFEGAAVTRSVIGGLRPEGSDAELIRTAQWLVHGF